MSLKGSITTCDPLDYDEFKRFLTCLRRDKEYFWELYMFLSFCTACRSSDVRKLRWKDVYDKSIIIIVEKKTGKARRITLNDDVRTKILELYELMECPDMEQYIFASDYRYHFSKPITIQAVNKNLKKFKQRYDLKCEHFSTHTLRKTFGRYVYESYDRSAESLFLLSDILRHSNPAITKRYIGIRQDEVDGVYNSIRF